jgi:hypothetical protein
MKLNYLNWKTLVAADSEVYSSMLSKLERMHNSVDSKYKKYYATTLNYLRKTSCHGVSGDMLNISIVFVGFLASRQKSSKLVCLFCAYFF